MMPLWGYILIIGLISVAALVATIAVGRSKENREGNKQYDDHTKKYWKRLSVYYVICTVLGVLLILIWIL